MAKIKSIPQSSLDEMREIILIGYRNGRSIRDIQREIQEAYNVTKSKARALARDQVASLNSQISQAHQRDAGVTEYVWSTSHDSRVRPCHDALDGKTFSWDDPPEMWYETKSRGIVYTGRRCHPGEDHLCRCVAIPKPELPPDGAVIFDILEDAGAGQDRPVAKIAFFSEKGLVQREAVQTYHAIQFGDQTNQPPSFGSVE